MRQVDSWFDDTEEERKAAHRQTASLGGLAIALFLVVIGLFLVRHLHAKSVLEDCLLSGRANCVMIVPALEP
jgi:hypothetical protein